MALSGAEAELYGLTKCAAQTLGFISLRAGLGVTVRATGHTDVSAATGMVRRRGLRKLRHINVRSLWFQDQLRHNRHNGAQGSWRAEIVAKYLAQEPATKRLELFDLRIAAGCACSADPERRAGLRGR